MAKENGRAARPTKPTSVGTEGTSARVVGPVRKGHDVIAGVAESRDHRKENHETATIIIANPDRGWEGSSDGLAIRLSVGQRETPLKKTAERGVP